MPLQGPRAGAKRPACEYWPLHFPASHSRFSQYLTPAPQPTWFLCLLKMPCTSGLEVFVLQPRGDALLKDRQVGSAESASQQGNQYVNILSYPRLSGKLQVVLYTVPQSVPSGMEPQLPRAVTHLLRGTVLTGFPLCPAPFIFLFTGLSEIISHITHFPPNPNFSVCFWGNPTRDILRLWAFHS